MAELAALTSAFDSRSKSPTGKKECFEQTPVLPPHPTPNILVKSSVDEIVLPFPKNLL